MTRDEILPLDNPTRSYAWGSRTFIPDLIGRAESENPQAELWIGAHPDLPSGIEGSTTDLLSHLRADPRTLLGRSAYATFGDQLPYLMKVLAVERPLSLQVHPDERDAAAGFEAESGGAEGGRLFKDPWHKPELLYALGEFHALCGFRAVGDSRALFAELAGRAAQGTFSEIADLLHESDHRQALSEACAHIARLPDEDVAAAVGCLPVASASVPDEALRIAGDVARTYPRDRAVLFLPLLQHVVLGVGDVLGVSPGMPHTYLHGPAVELTTCSDNTIRAGLTQKPTSVEQFLRVLDVGAGSHPVVMSRESSAAERTYTTGHAEFELSAVCLRAGRSVQWQAKPRTVLVLDGHLTLAAANGSTTLRRGQSVFVPAGAGAVELSGAGEAVQATTGV